MTGAATLIARAAMGTAIATCGCVLGRWRSFQQLPDNAFLRRSTAFLFLSRIALFTAVFLIGHAAPRADVVGVYFPEAEAFLHHQVQYVDFPSSYAPLHPFLDSVVITFWHTPLALILFAICVEALMFPLWVSLVRRFSPPGSESWIRTAAILYLFSPISLQFNAVDGHDNVHILLLLGLTLLLLLLARPLASGATLALSVIFFKFLPLIFAPVYFIAGQGTRRRILWAAGFIAIAAPPYVFLYWHHIPFLQALAFEASLRSPSDLPYLVEGLFGITAPAILWDALVVLALLAVYAFTLSCLRAGNRFRILNAALVAVLFALLLLSKKSWPNYLPMGLFPLCLIAARLSRPLQVAFYAFSVIAVVEGSFWGYAIGWGTALDFHAALLQPRTLAFLVLLLALVSCYALLLVAALRDMREAHTEGQHVLAAS